MGTLRVLADARAVEDAEEMKLQQPKQRRPWWRSARRLPRMLTIGGRTYRVSVGREVKLSAPRERGWKLTGATLRA